MRLTAAHSAMNRTRLVAFNMYTMTTPATHTVLGRILRRLNAVNRRCPRRIATPKLRARIPGGRRREIAAATGTSADRTPRELQAQRLKDKHRSDREHSNPGQRWHDAAGLSRIADDVVRHRRGEAEHPAKRKDARDDDEQREIAAVFEAETSRDEDASDYDDQLQAAGGG
jgi:hypothetical protein